MGSDVEINVSKKEIPIFQLRTIFKDKLIQKFRLCEMPRDVLVVLVSLCSRHVGPLQ